MIYATGISFWEEDLETLQSIVRIKLETDGNDGWKIGEEKIDGWFKKEDIHRWLKVKKDDGFEIKVKIYPYSELVPVETNGVKYVRATADSTEKNNLLELKTYYES